MGQLENETFYNFLGGTLKWSLWQPGLKLCSSEGLECFRAPDITY